MCVAVMWLGPGGEKGWDLGCVCGQRGAGLAVGRTTSVQQVPPWVGIEEAPDGSP